MRGLKRLIPEDVRDSLNANPTFQWFVVILLIVLGVLLVVKGVNAVQTKRLTAKDGRVYEGTTAQVLGGIYAALGAIIAVIAVVVKIAV
jgi:drug/metabolite transporter (DMT)-like permease